MTDFSVFMSLQGKSPGNSWLGGVSLTDYFLWTGMVDIKHKDFIDAVPIMRCEN